MLLSRLLHEARARLSAMTPLLKALLAVALVIPLAAYVAGSLVSSGAGSPDPGRQTPVILRDAPASQDDTTREKKRGDGNGRQADRSGQAAEHPEPHARGIDPDTRPDAPAHDDLARRRRRRRRRDPRRRWRRR